MSCSRAAAKSSLARPGSSRRSSRAIFRANAWKPPLCLGEDVGAERPLVLGLAVDAARGDGIGPQPRVADVVAAVDAFVDFAVPRGAGAPSGSGAARARSAPCAVWLSSSIMFATDSSPASYTDPASSANDSLSSCGPAAWIWFWISRSNMSSRLAISEFSSEVSATFLSFACNRTRHSVHTNRVNRMTALSGFAVVVPLHEGAPGSRSNAPALRRFTCRATSGQNRSAARRRRLRRSVS